MKYFLIIFLLFCGTSEAADWCANTNAEACWLINSDFGAGSVPDDSANSNSAAPVGDGNPDYSATANFTGSADFELSSSDYLTVSHGSDIDFADEDFTICATVSFESVSGGGAVIAKGNTDGTHYVLWLTNSGADIQFRMDDGSNVCSATWAGHGMSLDTFYTICGRRNTVGGNVRIYEGGVQKGTASEGSCGSLAGQDSRDLLIGAWGSSGTYPDGNYLDGKVDEIVIVREALSTVQMTNISTSGSGRGDLFYIDATGGSDSNSGNTTGAPWQTVSKVNEVAVAGETYYFKKGEVWREQITVPSNGSSGDVVTFTSYDSGDPPIINGANLVTTWSDSGDGVRWEATVTTEPKTVAMDGTRGTLKDNAGATAAEFDWFWASNTLTIYAATDPDARYTAPGVESGVRSANILVDGRDYITVDGIDQRLANGDCFDMDGTGSNITIQNSNVKWCGNDGVNCHDDVTDILVDSNIIEYSGQGRGVAQAAPGDGVSFHDNCAGIISNNIVQHNDKAGIDNIGATTVTVKNNWVQHNERNIQVGDNFSGTQDINYNVIITETDDLAGFNFAPSSVGGGTINFYNNTLYGAGAVTGVVLNSVVAGTVNLKNNIIENHNKGIDEEAANIATINNDYNDVFGNTTQFEGISKGGNSLETDPEMIDPDNEDFKLFITSGAKDTGVDLSLTEDHLGNPIVDSEDIGAYEYQGFIKQIISY